MNKTSKKVIKERNAQSGIFLKLSKKEQKERIAKNIEVFSKNYTHIIKKLAKE
ncbi:hypothetical protein KJ603_00155 [Patescibacteria group bacterium]|nr:hypothetical protein [Patescibacteria group bacterium]